MSTPKVHRIETNQVDDERSRWECSCGTSGSCDSFRVDTASDKHINYEAGEQRENVSRWRKAPGLRNWVRAGGEGQ